jgi:hypothetical protein
MLNHLWANHHHCDSCFIWLPDKDAWDNHKLSVHTAITSEHILAPSGTAFHSLEVTDAVRSIIAAPTSDRGVVEKQLACQLPALVGCGLCTKRFSSQEVLRLHMASSHASAQPPAATGDQDLPPNFEIRIMALPEQQQQQQQHQHQQYQQEEEEAAVSCLFCSDVFVSRYELDVHTMTDHAALLHLLPEEPGTGRRPYK